MSARTFRAPGRVNLIGEHTDYNLGFVLPIALDMATYATVHPPSEPGEFRVNSASRGETATWEVNSLASLQPKRNWTDYVIGVAQQLITRGFAVPSQQISIRSDVPEGAGLSSSAALEVSTALALLNGRPVEPLELAKLCQAAERNFVGMPSGIMDQYISVFGRERAAVMIDCRSLTHEFVTLPEVEIYAVNSMVKHELGKTAYRERVEECATAADAMHVSSLRDATPHLVENTKMPAVVARRARHIVTENLRVQLFVKAAARGDVERMGELFYESHVSMQHDYEISCEEIDFLVQAAKGIQGVYGARMTGGGFGGCTVNLVRPGCADRFREQIVKQYEERYRLTPPVFRCLPSGGAGEVGNS